MKKLIFILTFFLILINGIVFASPAVTVKDIEVHSSDGFVIKSTLEYPKNKTEFSTVVLLHSLGYSSEWWEDLPQRLLDNGYAVLKIDLRGHGKSVYNSKLIKTSWKNLKNEAFAKYPDDVVQVIETVKAENSKKVFFKDWAIVGADIGANTAILTADKIPYKPKTIVLLSPAVRVRGLFVPVKLANLDTVDMLSISGTLDTGGHKAQEYLKKFAQGTFTTYTSEAKTNGMLMLKSDKSLTDFIMVWLGEYLKG